MRTARLGFRASAAPAATPPSGARPSGGRSAGGRRPMDAFDHAFDNASAREPVVCEIVDLVAATVRDRVLVVGSLPPQGRDLALIVRPAADSALTEDPDAWTNAEGRAKVWGLTRALRLLDSTHRTHAPAGLSGRLQALVELVASTRGTTERVELLRRSLRARMPRRSRVVALSGLDGAGKSFQAQALQNALELLVCPTIIEWTPLGQNRAVQLIRSVTRAFRFV